MRILVAALNWGLGHSTRDIPIIRYLMKQNHTVHLASDGGALSVFRKEFPSLTSHELPSYNIRYPKSGSFALAILLQSPKVYRAMIAEKSAVKKLQEEYKYDVIISDNRFGVRHPDCFNVFLTHQYFLESPVFKKMVNAKNQKYIHKFDHILIPDYASTPNFSGDLSHADKIKHPHTFIGPLSRLERKPGTNGVKIVAVISGPEPQRTLFEKEVMEQLEQLPVESAIVRGLPHLEGLPTKQNKVTLYNHLKGEHLASLLNKAEWVISRTGYTTVMDLAQLKKKAVLVPTPGQTEQEYLGRVYKATNWFDIQKQGELSLSNLEFTEGENTQLPDVETGKSLDFHLSNLGL